MALSKFTEEMALLSKVMDAVSLRTRVIAHNMANVNTHGFKRSKVDFENAMTEALNSGDGARALKLKPEVQVDEGGRVKSNGNNVYMEDEVADLVKATIVYNTLNRIISGKVESLKLAVRGH